MIHVETLRMNSFMSHRDLFVQFPNSGIVLVQGPNGAGKSALVEGVAMAFWGKTLRGTSPWSDPTGAAAVTGLVLGEAIKAEHVVVRGKPGMDYLHRGHRAGEETNTRKQEALDRIVGEWGVWRRSAAFSTSDPAAFTGATDGERKRLLESILGLDAFDRALDACRLATRAASAALLTADTTAAVQRQKVDGLRRALEMAAEHAKLAAPVDDPEACDEDAMRHEAAARSLGGILDDRRKARELAAREVYAAKERAERAARDLARMAAGECPTCGQDIPTEVLSTFVHESEQQASFALNAAERAAALREANTDSDKADVVTVEAHRRAAADFRAAAARARTAERALIGAAERADGILAEVLDAQEVLEESGLYVAKLGAEKAELSAVDVVLGLRGVRANVLGQALAGLEAVANGWLARVAGAGLRVKLRPYSEKKTGGLTEALSLEIEGAGGGHGYQGASAGERRRIDIGMMLAIAETAAASRGAVPGTMFFDEVFDTLDDEGVESVSRVLGELAQDRCVVVITHAHALAESLPAAMRLYVERGAVTVQ